VSKQYINTGRRSVQRCANCWTSAKRESNNAHFWTLRRSVLLLS